MSAFFDVLDGATFIRTLWYGALFITKTALGGKFGISLSFNQHSKSAEHTALEDSSALKINKASLMEPLSPAAWITTTVLCLNADACL